ncbi:PQQ-binding-like beta-propeller repeat protein [Chloroflexota bacterium]
MIPKNKTTRLYLFLGILLLSSMLVSCTGAGATTSWPGVTVDLERETIYLANGPHVYAVDMNEGLEKWRFPDKAANNISFYAAPALTEEGHLIVSGYDNLLYGLNPAEFEPANQTFLDVRSTSVEQAKTEGLEKLQLTEADVIVEVKEQGSAGFLGFGSSLSCVRLTIKDVEDSEAAAGADDSPCDPTKWAFVGAKNRFVAAPLVAHGLIFAPNADNNLYTLNLSGNLRWQYEVDHTLWSKPTVNGKTVYISSMDHHVYAIDIETGDLLWKSEDLGGAIAGDPTLGPDGVLYVGTLGSNMVALDTASGSVLWRFTADGWVWSGPTLEGEVLYFGDLSGNFYAISTADGQPIWPSVKPDAGDSAAISDKPLLVGDTLYLVTQSGKLYAIKKESGATRWSKDIDEKATLYGSPVLAGELIVVAPLGAEAMLYAFDIEGSPRWQFTPQ